MELDSVVRIGTRGSDLALAQAHELKRRLLDANPGRGLEIAIVVISPTGDRVLDRPLSEIGGKGLFTQEIEAQLLDGSIDMAVHSSKDMPTQLPEGLELSAFLPRERVADAFVSRSFPSLAELPRAAVVGSASLRRQALIRRIRPDLSVVTFRGIVNPGLRKLDAGGVTATLPAGAGRPCLGFEEHITELMPIDEFPPAPGQGAICVETRIGDAATGALLAGVNHADTADALACERAFLAALDGSCRTPIAGHARSDGERITFHGMILRPDGTQWHETRVEGSRDDAVALGRDAARIVREAAGERFFEGWA